MFSFLFFPSQQILRFLGPENFVQFSVNLKTCILNGNIERERGVFMAKRKIVRRTDVRKSVVYVDVRSVNWVLVLVMSIIFGVFGVDRFIMGKVGTGILKLITLGGLGIWWLTDIILIATKYQFKNVEWTD